MQQGRPSTSPQPVMTPSAGASTPSIARWAKCGRPWMPSSTKVPSSTSRSIRSRAVSLPRSCCLAIFSSPPPSFAFSRRSCSCSVSSPSGAVPGRRFFSPAPARCSPSYRPFHCGSRFSKNAVTPSTMSSVREGERELRAQELERVVERHVLLAVHRVVAEPHQHRALRGELARPLGDRGVELLGRHDLVGEPVLDRLLGAQPLAQQHHLVDLLARDVAVDDRHDHVGEGADVDLRRAEGRPLLGDHQVAGEGEPHPAGQHVAVGGAERGLAEPRHQPEELEEEVGGEVFGDERHVGREAAEVGTGAEDLVAGAGEDDGADLLGVARLLHRVDQLGQHLAGEHVALLRVVQRHRGDAVGDLVGDQLVAPAGSSSRNDSRLR